MIDGLMPGADRDLVRPLQKRIAQALRQIMLKHEDRQRRGRAATACRSLSRARTAGRTQTYDQVLVAVGRTPERRQRSAPKTPASAWTQRGFIPVDKQMRTNVPHIFAIGDIVGQPMLAHKAKHEGRSLPKSRPATRPPSTRGVIPSVAYTDPEIAWVGVTEDRGQGARHRATARAVFPGRPAAARSPTAATRA